MEKNFDLSYYLQIALRRKFYFVIALFLTVTLSMVYSYIRPKVYRASAILMIQRNQIISPLVKDIAVSPGMRDRLVTIQSLITSRSRVLKVIKQLDLDVSVKNPIELEYLIEDMRRRIHVENFGDDIIQISFEEEDPVKIEKIVNTITNNFLEDSLSLNRGQTHAAFEFIKEQLEVYRRELEESEAALKEFKRKNLDHLPGQTDTNLAKLEAAERQLLETELTLKELLMEKEALQKQLVSEKPLILAFATTDNNPSAKVQQLEAQLASLLTHYKEKYPDVIRVKAELEKARQELAEGPKKASEPNSGASQTSALNPIYQQIREELNNLQIRKITLETRHKDLLGRIAEYKKKAETVPETEQEYARLQRDYGVNNEIYQMLLRRLEEARISKELNIKEGGERYTVLDPAQVPVHPVKPNRAKIIFMGLVFGIGLGAGLVYFAEFYLDQSLKDLREVQAFFKKIPILTAIPQVLFPEEINKQRRSTLLTLAGTGLYLALVFLVMIREFLKLRYPYLPIP